MPYVNGKYITEREVEQVMDRLTTSEREKFRGMIKSSSGSGGGDFLVSAAIGAVTGSSLLGGLLGGDIVGGLLGDALEGTDDSWL